MVSVDRNKVSSNTSKSVSGINNAKNNSEAESLRVRKAAAQNLSIAYDNAINTLKQYQGKDAKFYQNKLGKFMNVKNLDEINLYRKNAIKLLEQEKEFAINRLEYTSTHEEDFKREFKDFTSKNYDESLIKEYLENSSVGKDNTVLYEKAYGVETTDKKGNTVYKNNIIKNALKKSKHQVQTTDLDEIIIKLLGSGFDYNDKNIKPQLTKDYMLFNPQFKANRTISFKGGKETNNEESATKEFLKWANSKEGQKIFPDSKEIIEYNNINIENWTDYQNLINTLKNNDKITDSTKSAILYAATVSNNAKSTNELINVIGSDLESIDELDVTLISSVPSKVQKTMGEMYKNIKAGKYTPLIKDIPLKDIFAYHIALINENNYDKIPQLYDYFAKDNNISEEWFTKVIDGLENSDVEGIKQFYELTKDIRKNKPEENWLAYRKLKVEDIPAKTEIYNIIKSSDISQDIIYNTLSKTNKDNLDIAKKLVEKTYIKKEGDASNVSTILQRLNNNLWNKDFIEENFDILTNASQKYIRNISTNNITLTKAIEENKEITASEAKQLLEFTKDKNKNTEAQYINQINTGIYRVAEIDIIDDLKNKYITIVKNHLSSKDIELLKKRTHGNSKKLEESFLQAGHFMKNNELNDDEKYTIQQILKKLPNYEGLSENAQASKNLIDYYSNREDKINEINSFIEDIKTPNNINKEDILKNLNNLYPLFNMAELTVINETLKSTDIPLEKKLTLNYSKLVERNIVPVLQENYKSYPTPRHDFTLELLDCNDKEFQEKSKNLTSRFYELNKISNFNEWQRVLNQKESEYNVFKIPLEERIEEPIDITAYETQMRKQMTEPVTYDPIEAAKIIAKAEERQSYYSYYQYAPDKINPFEKLQQKNKKEIIPLTSTAILMKELKETGHVKLTIPNEGGLNIKAYDAIIHPDDRNRINIEEDADIKIRYGKKLQWSNFKIARDILQNYYDGHGHTLEGVNIEVTKTENNTYKVKVSGESSWDYRHLDEMGSSTKHDPLDAGGYGEGTRAVAVSLLSKPDINNVKYASGAWTMTYGRSSDDLQTAYMTQTLSENQTNVKGSTIEFETKSNDLVQKLLEAKDYFYHPHNPDFHNFDFENEFFGINLHPKNGVGNIYLIQRYETNGIHNNGLEGATIVFKTRPDHPTLNEKDGTDFKLGTGVDRAQIPSYDINRILSRYIKTMTDEELTQTISSMEKFWSIDENKNKYNDVTLYIPFVEEAYRRNLGIDFKDSHYVYIKPDEPLNHIEMAKILGYKLAGNTMQKVGMPSYTSVDTSKAPHQPTENQSKQIRLLEEGVRVLQECTDLNTKDLLNSEEIEKPTYMFKDGDFGTGAEAIIENQKYEGHWMRDSHLLMQDYIENLATFLHEISHKSGSDTSVNFSMQLIKMQSHITNVLMHNPNAIKKFQVLSKMFNEIKSQELNHEIKTEIIEDNDFNRELYQTQLEELLSKPQEYKKYVEEEPTTQTTESPYIINALQEDTGILLNKNFEDNYKKTSRFNLGGIKKYTSAFINKIFKRKQNSLEIEDIPPKELIRHNETNTPTNNIYKYQKYTPQEPETYTTLKSSDSLITELEFNGHTELSIPDSGGLNPKISQLPQVENDPDFNKTVRARMKVSYAQKRDWSNEKIARDLMQNFYDGNGHTLEGVDIKIVKNNNNTYTIRIDGKGIYDYHHLKRMGSSDKDNPKDAGGFGEGSRIIAGCLLASGSKHVKYACKDWQVDFTSDDTDNKNDASIMRTLTKSEKAIDGNFVEFDTQDLSLIKAVLDSKNYFYSPHNPDFRNLDIENKFFGFKVTPEKNGNLYYIQRFQTPDKKMNNGLKDMTIIFKQAAFGDEFEKKVGYSLDLNTTRDRMAIDAVQINELAIAYIKTLSDAELVKALSVLEPVLTSKSSEDLKFKYTKQQENNLSYHFASRIRHEIARRGINIDFGNKKIVCVDKKGEYSTNLDKKEEQYFQNNGYIFCDNDGHKIGIKKAHDLYVELHKPHSIKPTEKQTKQLQLINEAIKLFVENDKYNLFNNAENTNLYLYDENSNIKSNTGYHAEVQNNKLQGIFINTKLLETEKFSNIITKTIAEMLDKQTKKESAEYSYNLTDLIRSQINTFITKPQIREKLQILEQKYKELQ